MRSGGVGAASAGTLEDPANLSRAGSHARDLYARPGRSIREQTER